MNTKNNNTHILVVDDEPLILDMVRCGLEDAGCNVSVGNDGLEALCLMSENDFDLVLMDIRMPVMDGLAAIKFLRTCEQGEHQSLTAHQELAQALHARRKGARIPVVALTGNIGDRGVALQLGMDDFITKPFNFAAIYDLIDKFCGKAKDGSPIERRRHPRFVIEDNTVVVSADNTGQVVDISASGLAIKFTNHEAVPNEWSATLFNEISKTSIPDLPLKLVRKEEVEFAVSSGLKTQIVGAMFYNLDASQQDQINQFTKSCVVS